MHPGDAEHLYQAFLNLVANGLEAMGPGGHLTLRTGRSEDRDWLTLSARARRSAASRSRSRIRVPGSPSGGGQIFNPFFTTKAGGTGLGLALTHKIIEDHRGRITFRSVPGTGTTFHVILPIAPVIDEPPSGSGDV